MINLRDKLPKITCKRVQKKAVRHGHLWLHVVYWIHGIAEHPTIFVFVLYGGICVFTLLSELVFHEEHHAAEETP